MDTNALADKTAKAADAVLDKLLDAVKANDVETASDCARSATQLIDKVVSLKMNT